MVNTLLKRGTVDFLEGHEDEEIQVMHEYDLERTRQRFRRMKSKFEDYELVNCDLDEDTLMDLYDSEGSSNY